MGTGPITRQGLAGISALLLLSLLGAAHAQQLYRWVDKSGRVTYSQHPPPTGAAKSVQSKNLSSSVVETSTLPYAAQVAARNFPVTLYASPDCGAPCDNGRDSLQKRGIPFREVSVADAEGFEALKSLSDGKTQVPVIQIGSRTLFGYDAAAWKNTLDEVGYPSTILGSTQRAQARTRPAATSGQPNGLPLVRLFTHPQCGDPCQSAREYLAGRSVPYQEVSADNGARLAELRKLSDSGAVPVLVIGTTVTNGFDADEYQAAIEAAGYPPATAIAR